MQDCVPFVQGTSRLWEMINSQTDAFPRERPFMASHLEMKYRSSRSPPVQTSSEQNPQALQQWAMASRAMGGCGF